MKDLAEEAPRVAYFEKKAPQAGAPTDEGTREMGPLYPFLICGGENTERFYFLHINDTTRYKFNIRPRYFGDESNYTDSFPKRIKEILDMNDDAKIFCIFDWDTIAGDTTRQRKHSEFLGKFAAELENGTLTMCPSMPSIEYWFLLHFVDSKLLLKDYSKVAALLADYLKPCFPDPSIPLKKLLKKRKHLTDSTWVKNLCSEGRLDLAIERAERNIIEASNANELDKISYSYVYRVFKAY